MATAGLGTTKDSGLAVMVTECTRPASCGLAAAGKSVAASVLWVLRCPQVASRTPSLGFQGSCEFPGYEISPPFADSQGCVAGCWRARGPQAPRPLPAGGQLPSGARGRRPRSFPARSLLCPRTEGPITSAHTIFCRFIHRGRISLHSPTHLKKIYDKLDGEI